MENQIRAERLSREARVLADHYTRIVEDTRDLKDEFPYLEVPIDACEQAIKTWFQDHVLPRIDKAMEAA